MTTSQFMEQVKYMSAMQQELAHSISQINSIQSARVHIASAKQSVFVRDRTPTKASVVINPQPGRQSRGLARVATEIRTVRPTDLARSQLPDRIETATDFIYKPDAWWRGERG